MSCHKDVSYLHNPCHLNLAIQVRNRMSTHLCYDSSLPVALINSMKTAWLAQAALHLTAQLRLVVLCGLLRQLSVTFGQCP